MMKCNAREKLLKFKANKGKVVGERVNYGLNKKEKRFFCLKGKAFLVLQKKPHRTQS